MLVSMQPPQNDLKCVHLPKWAIHAKPDFVDTTTVKHHRAYSEVHRRGVIKAGDLCSWYW